MLRDEGRLELDAPLVDYLPSFEQPGVLESFHRQSLTYATRPAERPITVRQLLTHTSGFGYWFLDAELRMLMDGPPDYFNAPFLMYEPGTRFAYGISMDVLGQIIEPLSGLSLERFFQQRIFAPLGLSSTGFDLPNDPTRLAALHVRESTGFVERPNELASEPPRGGGGLYSTARDYLTLLRLFLNDGCHDRGRLLDASTLTEMTSNQIGALFAEPPVTAVPQHTHNFIFMDGTQKFGFGVMLETRDQPTGRAAGSFAWAGIYNTYFWVDPRAGFAGVVLMQTSPFSDPVNIEVCRRFERAVYEHVVARRGAEMQ
jgi:CubicO group peptidase (beta-lactamase class C family)